MRLRLALLAIAFALAAPLHALDHDAWLADFRQILTEMSAHYANLDSALDDRRIPLATLRKDTEAAIRNAKTDDEARAAINSFIAAFGDGHVRVSWTPAPPTSIASTPDTRALCDRLGYNAVDPRGLDFARFDNFRPLDNAEAAQFPAGILRIDGKRKAGILRIRLFGEDSHPELCTAALQGLALAADAPCDGECANRVQLAVGDLLTAALERQVEALRRAGATTLVVDLTGNGGGSNWVEPAARVLTPVTLRSPRFAFIRHPHWVTQLRERLADVDYDLAHGGEPHELLLQAKQQLTHAIDEAGRACDRGGIWNDPPARPACSLVVPDLLFATGNLAYSKAGSLSPELHARGVLFNPLNYAYHEGVNRLPLVVLVDDGTASASEYFGAMMQDNGAATVAGIATRGSGCGYTNGGIPATLQSSGATLFLPDCVRLRRDGTNEVADGITPDVLIPWRRFESRYQKAQKAVQAIARLAK